VRRDDSIPETEPKSRWAWYCTILDYLPFNPPVPAKVDGGFFENIPTNRWRNGVRSLNQATYQEIIAAAGVQNSTLGAPAPAPQLPPLEDVIIPSATTEGLLVPCAAPTGEGGSARQAGTSGPRYSRQSTIIGKRAERIAFEWVKRTFLLARQVRWVADAGQTPGWDIEVTDEHGGTIAVEVKGASGRAFLNFDLTPGELRAAQEMGSRYLLVLVADCLGVSPRLQVLRGLNDMITAGAVQLVPSGYRVSVAA